MPEQVSMEDIARRRRVEKVRKAAARMETIENALADLTAKLPALRREMAAIREQIETALAGQDEDDGEAAP